MKKSLVIIILLACAAIASYSQTAEIVSTVANTKVKMDGVTWDGKNIWIVTYQSIPLEWKIAKLEKDGSIVSSFTVPVTSLDDIHNMGMSCITSDGTSIWACNWNEGIIYQYNDKGKTLKSFGVPSVNQLIPVGIAWDGKFLWVLHWSDKNLYKLDKNGKELEKISLRKLTPMPDMGLAWDGTYFWVGTKGANRITKITPEGEVKGQIKGPKSGGGIRDLAWDGEYLLVVYQQDNTIYKLSIKD
ncbi:MAG: hypothetical protein E4H36_06910 [Spirochaetales bacterium]|nr:MAG: hypothetical protein E4H36_06910 [Spirochaetales bacterium]